MIDFHCHLDLYPNAIDLVQEVNARNEFTLVVTTSPRAWDASSKVFEGYKCIHMALGLHPEIVVKKQAELPLLIAAIPKTRFIGEVGVDGSSQHLSSVRLQTEIFNTTLDACNQAGGRILSIHSRNAAARVLDSIEVRCGFSVPVLHWFSGTAVELKHALSLGCWFSVGPAMLAGSKGRQLAAQMPPDRVLPETDGPFAQRQSQPLMPWQASEVVDSLAEIWLLDHDEVIRQMRSNLNTLLSSVPQIGKQ